MGIVLNLAYLAAILLAGPWILCSRFRKKKSLGNLRQKFFGELPPIPEGRPCIWLHAVSVGEVVQLRPILERLEKKYPDHHLAVTTTTTTGYAVALEKYGGRHTVSYFPFDFTWSVRRALKAWNPALVILVELELWPNFIRECSRAAIPVSLINGRITERSWKHYRYIRPLIGSLLKRLNSIQVQNESYARRFIDLGAPRQLVEVTGSIKFDGVRCDRSSPAVNEIRTRFGLQTGEVVFIAGSTQAPEEELALDCYRRLKPEFPNLRLMLVPRHAERFEEVAELVLASGLPLLRRTEVKGGTRTAAPSSDAVLLLDTLGELSAAWGLADLAFVGGSLGQRGGQNMIEPAGYGACVFFGPNTWNFRDAAQLLLDNRAAILISAGEDFLPTIRQYLSQPESAAEIGDRAREVVFAQQGAADRTLARLGNVRQTPVFTRNRAA